MFSSVIEKDTNIQILLIEEEERRLRERRLLNVDYSMLNYVKCESEVNRKLNSKQH